MSKKKADVIDLKTGVGIETVEYKEVTYTCPVRGKVTQKVKVTKYKAQKVEVDDMVRTSDPVINDFDMSEITGQEVDDDLSPMGGDDV